jgi:hypothetical protein
MRHFPLPRARHVLAFVSAVVAAGVAIAFSVQPVAAARSQNATAERVLAYLTPPAATTRTGRCFIISGSQANSYRPDECLALDPGRPNYLLMGDSHAASIWYGLQQAMPEVNLMQATASGCKPLLPLRGAARCTGVLQAALTDRVDVTHLDTIILAARWQLTDLPRLPATLRALAARATRVVVLGPTSEYDTALPKLLARGLVTGNQGLAAANLDRQRFGVDAAVRAEVRSLGFAYASQLDILCPQQQCREYVTPGVPVKFDYGHYTEAGSLFVGQALREQLIRATS